MKKIILIISVIAILTSCYYRTVRGNGNMSSETRNLNHFSGVRLLGSMNIVLVKGDRNTVEVDAEENILPFVETYVEDDKLVVKFRNNININTHKDVIVKVTTPHIREIDLLGSGDI